MYWEDTDSEWARIENELIRAKKGKKDKKITWDNPLQEKYGELNLKYGIEYSSNDGSYECEDLLDDLRAFERVFRIMGWSSAPKK